MQTKAAVASKSRPPLGWLVWTLLAGTAGFEDVAFFAVLVEVEPLELLLFGDTQADRGVDQLQEDERDDGRPDPRNRRGDDLRREYISSFEDPQRLAGADVPDCPAGKHAGEDGPQRATQAVLLRKTVVPVSKAVGCRLKCDLSGPVVCCRR